MAQMKVHRDESTGEPQVECPLCNELVSPVKHSLFDSYDCECGAVIDSDEMKLYERVLNAWNKARKDEEDYLE
jgi:hypothetical protein